MAFEEATLVSPAWWPCYLLLSGGDIHQANLGSPVSGRVFFTPFWFPRPARISKLAITPTIVSGLTGIKLGIYTDNGFTPQGGTLLGDTGGLDASSANPLIGSLSPTIKVPAGIVWVGVMFQDSTSSIVITQLNELNQYFIDLPGEDMAGAQFDNPAGYGPFPAICPTVTQDPTNIPLVYARVDSFD